MESLYDESAWAMTSERISIFCRNQGMYIGYKFKQVDRYLPHIVTKRDRLIGKKKFAWIFTVKSYEQVEEIIEFTIKEKIIKRLGKDPYLREYRDYDIEFAIDREDKIIYWKVVNIGEVRRRM